MTGFFGILGFILGLYLYGTLVTGPGSFSYGVNNPNTSCLNGTTGNVVANTPCSSAVSTFQTTLVPIVASIGMMLVLLLAAIIKIKGKKKN